MLTIIYKFIYFKIMKWKLVGAFPKELKKYVIIAVPHTSWHDFYIGLLIRKIANTKINFLGKKEIFIFPFGYYFRAVGGRALDRTPGQNKVEAIAKLFETNDELRLTLAPEGTRDKVSEWKTGFYHIAKAANVPIVMVTFDFGKKQNKISKPFYPTDNMEEDFAFMKNFFKGVKGKVPEKSF
ncbi:MAG: 1-acyl-sn-glycerol-3-phosphate acyltransferase [Oceanihabitans sp.]|nr:1-acyl-sn-glycerol-3-phosphate acyltransferase [Oceanihabitans sp.]